MTDEIQRPSREAAVLRANEQFYRAVESLDMQRMADVWFKADWVTCIHPGWAVLTGWKAVCDSWQRIFQKSENMRIEVSNVGLRIENATAWITCRESILHLSSSGVSSGTAVATNIFLETPEGWKMALHHVSAVPDERSPTAGGREG